MLLVELCGQSGQNSPGSQHGGTGGPWARAGLPAMASVLWALTWVQRAWEAHALQVVVATLFMFL